MAALPAPMLARSGRLPLEPGWGYELNLDGFRGIVRCGRELDLRSRRGWRMTELLPELEALPAEAVLDGELVALGDDGWPDFPSVCERILNGHKTIPLVYVIFDVLEFDERSTMHLPLSERGQLLESFQLHDRYWQTSAVFDDGEALFAVAQEHGLRGSWRSGCATVTGRGSAAGEDQEPRLLALRTGARGRDQGAAARHPIADARMRPMISLEQALSEWRAAYASRADRFEPGDRVEVPPGAFEDYEIADIVNSIAGKLSANDAFKFREIVSNRQGSSRRPEIRPDRPEVRSGIGGGVACWRLSSLVPDFTCCRTPTLRNGCALMDRAGDRRGTLPTSKAVRFAGRTSSQAVYARFALAD